MALAKLVKEIDNAEASGQLSRPCISYAEAIRLPYLVVSIKEGMRIHPSVGYSLPRHVPPEGAAISGRYFKAGTRVGVSAHIMHRDKGVFGEDADVFNPDRWLREGASSMDRYVLSFGAGTRICLGKNVSSLSEQLESVLTRARSL